MTYSARAIRAAAAGVGGSASIIAFLSAVEANTYYDVDAQTIAYAIVLALPFAIYFWLVRTKRRSVELGLLLCSVTALWIVYGYGSVRTDDDGLGFLAPLLAWVVTLAVALLGGLYDRLTTDPPSDA